MAANERKILTTLTIGGEKEFKAAMDNAYRGLKVLSSELKANSAEFDKNDKSVEGLTKRGELLRKEIDQQKEIVNALSKAVDESAEAYGEDSKKTDEYRIKLNNAQAALSNMEGELKQNNETLADAKSKTKAMSDALKDAGEKFETAGKKFEEAGKTVTKYLTTAIVAVGTAATKMASDYETAVNKINTLDLNASSEKIQGISDDILDLSSSTGVAANDIAEATYQMGSALGSLGEDVVDYVEIATKAAIGGFTDAETAANGLTTVFNTYGYTTAEEMGKISDLMITAQNLGKTTFGEIAASVGNVVPIFSQAGGSAEELMASYAILTKNGIATAQATTGLTAALSNILKPTKAAETAAKKIGLEFSAASLQSKGWAGFLQEIMEKSGGNTEVLTDLFGSVQALNSMMVLTSEEGFEQFDEAMDSMQESTGATEKAYDKMQDSFGASLNKMVTSLKNLGIQIGTQIIPKIQPLIEKVQDGIKIFAEMDDETKNMIITIAGIAAAAGPALIVIGKLSQGIGAMSTALGFLVAHPAILAIGAIAAASGILFIELNKTSDGMKAFEKRANDVVKNTTDFSELVSNMTPNILDVNSLISSTGKTVGELQTTIDEKEQAINAILRTAMEERRDLRKDELDQIAAYNADIASLSQEKIDMYRDVELAKLRQIQLEEGDLTAEQMEQHRVDMEEALNQANKVSEDAYVARLAVIENTFKAMGEIGSAAYLEEQQSAKDNYKVQLEENQKYYNEANASLLKSAGVLVGVEKKKNAEFQIARQEDLENAQSFYETLYNDRKKYWENVNHMDSEEAQNAIAVAEQWRQEQLLALQAEEQPWLNTINQKYENSKAAAISYYNALGTLDSEEAQKSLSALEEKKNNEISALYESFSPKLDAINEGYDAQYNAIFDQYGRVNELQSEQAQTELSDIKMRGEQNVNALIAAYQEEEAALDESASTQISDRKAMFNSLHYAYEDYLSRMKTIEESGIAQNKSYNAVGLANLLNVNKQKKDANSDYAVAFQSYLDKINEIDTYSFLKLYDTAKQAGEEIPAEYTLLLKNTLAAFATAPDDMQDEGYEMLMGLLDGVTDPALRKKLEQEGTDTAAEVVDAIWKEWDLGSPSRVARGMGENFIQGLEDGMNNKRLSASKTASDIGSLLVQTFKNIFGIRSPSTVMRDQVGKMMMEGWAEGITGNKNLVSMAISGTIPDTITSALSLDVTRNFYDVARSAGTYEDRSARSGGMVEKKTEINYNYTVHANETSYAEQQRIAQSSARGLVRELSALA